jgi:predicted Zn-ribbon and HTH transcriptional regulator
VLSPERNLRGFVSNCTETLSRTRRSADFLTDSEPEVSASAYAAARDYFPDVFINVSTEQESQVMQGLRQTRPVLVRGYESMVMVSSSCCTCGQEIESSKGRARQRSMSCAAFAQLRQGAQGGRGAGR